jgi:hypothetical protein
MDGILVLLIFSSTGFRYSITGNKLYLKVWFISMGSANIDDITSVERTYDLTSAPASALKRLCICFKNGVKYLNWLTWQCAPNWLISPVREKEFIEALRAINPDICVSIPETKEKWRIWDWDI